MSRTQPDAPPSDEEIDDFAQHAYRAYNSSTGGKTFLDADCPLWDGLGEVQKEAWREATRYLLGAFATWTLPDPGWPGPTAEGVATNDS